MCHGNRKNHGGRLRYQQVLITGTKLIVLTTKPLTITIEFGITICIKAIQGKMALISYSLWKIFFILILKCLYYMFSLIHVKISREIPSIISDIICQKIFKVIYILWHISNLVVITVSTDGLVLATIRHMPAKFESHIHESIRYTLIWFIIFKMHF